MINFLVITTWVLYNWMICGSVFSHLAFIFLATYNGMTFTDAPESIKQMCTLKLNISNVNKNLGRSVLASIMNALSTNVKVPGDLLDPFSKKVALPKEVWPSAHRRMSCWLMIFVDSIGKFFHKPTSYRLHCYNLQPVE